MPIYHKEHTAPNRLTLTVRRSFSTSGSDLKYSGSHTEMVRDQAMLL